MSAFEPTSVSQRHILPADLMHIEPLREAWEAFLQTQGLSMERVEEWRLAFTETVVNAIVHGAKEVASKNISVNWWAEGQTICLEVIDPGTGPDLARAADPYLPDDPLADHGRGLFIIKQFCDVWEHWRGTEGYRQVLKKTYPDIIPMQEMDPVLEQALNEISLCYESLAAFYRLGEALIRSDRLGEFIGKALDDLGPLVRGDELGIAFNADHLNAALVEDVLQLEAADQSLIEKSVILSRLYKEGGEYVWESLEEAKEDVWLAQFGCGWGRAIQAGGVTVGVLFIARTQADPHFNAAELNSLRTFTDLFGIAIAQANNAIARETEKQALRELEIAADLQEKLFPIPELPTDPRWSFFVKRTSARQVGGDYVDALVTASGDLVLVMVDVMGKGVSAAFLAAMIRTSLRLNLSLGHSLETLIRVVNQVLCEELNDLTMFATCAICWVSADTQQLSIVNAGHCPVILSSGAGVIQQIEPSGPPLGLFATSEYVIERHILKGDETIILVTDGLYEWPVKGAAWGWDTWMEFIKDANRVNQPQTLWDDLQLKIKHESDDEEAGDDQSFLYWNLKPAATFNRLSDMPANHLSQSIN